MSTPPARSPEEAKALGLARKVVTYGCGCSRGVLGKPGQEPRPPYTCPDHGGEFVSGETLDPVTGKSWRQ